MVMSNGCKPFVFMHGDDPSIVRFGKQRKTQDVRWGTCPVGSCFIVEVSELEVRKNSKRPSIPATYRGKFKTNAIQRPVWVYQVTRIK